MIGRSIALKCAGELSSEVEYSSGGRTSVRISSGLSCSRGRPGMNDTASATSTMSNGADTLYRRATAVSASEPASTPITVRISIGNLLR
jgi:hypothetical protein